MARKRNRAYDNAYNNTPERKAYMRDYYALNKPDRWHTIKSRYGITKAAWETLFDGQSQRCAICGSEEHQALNWHTDHCHVTGKVRGILCRKCNHMLGNAEDDPQRLLAGVAYLAEHQETAP